MNEKGYTLLESLFQLVVLLIFSNIFILTMYWYAQAEKSIFSKENLAWELFVNDLNSYLVEVKSLQILNIYTGIRIENEMNTFDIEQNGGVIRKQVRNEGHEPMLFNIQNCRMKYVNEELTIAIEFENGMKKERTFYVPLVEK